MAEREQIIQRVRERLIDGTLTEAEAQQVLSQLRGPAEQQQPAAQPQSEQRPALGSGTFLNNPVLDPIHEGAREMLTGFAQNIPMPQGARDWATERGLLSEGRPENLMDAGLRGAGDATFWTGAGLGLLGARGAMAVPQNIRNLYQGGNVAQAGVAPAVQSQMAQQSMGTGGRAGQTILDTARRAPLLAGGGELAAGGGAGAGGLIGRDIAEASGAEGGQQVAGEAVGGLLGGVAGASIPGAGPRAVRAGVDWSVSNLLPFTDAGAAPRAASQTQRRAQDPEGAAQSLEALIPGVTPARQTGDPGLMAQEQRILDDNPQLRRQVEEDLSGAQRAQETEARQLFGSTRSQGDWELEVMQRTAAPGAEIQPGDPDAMLTQAFESFQPAYNAVRGQQVSGEGLGRSLEEVIRNPETSAGTQVRNRVASEVNGRLETLAARAGEGTDLTSDDLLDLRHALRTDIRDLRGATTESAQERQRLLQNTERRLTEFLENQLPEDLTEQLRAVDSQYRQHKVVENAVFRSGERGLDPERLSEAIRQGAQSEGQFARGGDAELRSLALTGWPMDRLIESPQIARRATSGLSAEQREPLKANAANYIAQRARTADPQTGEGYLSGAQMRRLVTENAESLRAIGMNDSDIGRMNAIADNLITIQRQPPAAVQELYEDSPSLFLELGARLAGALGGQRLAQGRLSAGLVMSQFMSKRARDSLDSMTGSEAERMMVEAATDPQLYRALLTGPTSTRQQQREAAQRLQGWLLGETERAGSGMLEEVEPGFVTQPDGTATPTFTPQGSLTPEERRATPADGAMVPSLRQDVQNRLDRGERLL